MTQTGPYGCCGCHTLRVGGHGGRRLIPVIRTSPSGSGGVFSRLDTLNAGGAADGGGGGQAQKQKTSSGMLEVRVRLGSDLVQHPQMEGGNVLLSYSSLRHQEQVRWKEMIGLQVSQSSLLIQQRVS